MISCVQCRDSGCQSFSFHDALEVHTNDLLVSPSPPRVGVGVRRRCRASRGRPGGPGLHQDFRCRAAYAVQLPEHNNALVRHWRSTQRLLQIQHRREVLSDPLVCGQPGLEQRIPSLHLPVGYELGFQLQHLPCAMREWHCLERFQLLIDLRSRFHLEWLELREQLHRRPGLERIRLRVPIRYHLERLKLWLCPSVHSLRREPLDDHNRYRQLHGVVGINRDDSFRYV